MSYPPTMEIVEDWTPHQPVQVETYTISQTDLVNVQIVLDRMPDRSWTGLFTSALAAASRHDRAATFLGRYICLQPRMDRMDQDIAVVQGAISEANGRYEREVAVVRHRAPRMTAAA